MLSLLVVPLLAQPFLAGCTHWPDAGQGGMAELRAPAVPAGSAPLQARLDCSLRRVALMQDAVTQSGVLTGRMQLLSQTAGRAQREFYAGLPVDAERTLQRLDTETDVMRAELPPAYAPALPTSG